MKHTQGEWKSFDNEQGTTTISANETEIIIAEVFPFEFDKIIESEANSKLIAAAPDLLEALQELMNVYHTTGHLLSYEISMARKAIKKATE